MGIDGLIAAGMLSLRVAKAFISTLPRAAPPDAVRLSNNDRNTRAELFSAEAIVRRMRVRT
jgi:hypothetical protein